MHQFRNRNQKSIFQILEKSFLFKKISYKRLVRQNPPPPPFPPHSVREFAMISTSMYIPFWANTWTLFTRKQNLRSVRIKYIPCVVRASSSVGRDRLSSMFRRLFLIVTTRINHAWNFSGNLDTIHNMIRQSRFLCWSETWCGSIRGARDDDTMTFTYVCTQYVLMFFFFAWESCMVRPHWWSWIIIYFRRGSWFRHSDLQAYFLRILRRLFTFRLKKPTQINIYIYIHYLKGITHYSLIAKYHD